uniref:Transposase n=1 Tax=uncultured Chloroflexota bacterium TaxID=166587 RepID=H5SMX3_9CHLR|nr:transposase [uncultured Chloroflexota bacterium]
MESLPQNGQDVVQATEKALKDFLQPFTCIFPDQRLKRNGEALIQGLIVSQSPHITKAMWSGGEPSASAWAQAKRGYRLVHNSRVSVWQWTKSLYHLAQRTVHEEGAEELVVAIDPVQFEKPYARRVEGVSQVHKSTPPDLHGEARLTWGYPAITATVVNLSRPATTYARWFSYRAEDFVSQNREIQRAVRMTRTLFPDQSLCFLMDATGDDHKFFEWVSAANATFIVRAGHRERRVEVWNERLKRWEPATVGELIDLVIWRGTFQVEVQRKGKMRRKTVRLGWYRIRLPESGQELSLVVVNNVTKSKGEKEDEEEERLFGLLTNRRVLNLKDAQRVYQDWRLRHRIEDGYRFDQEAGLDIEQVMVHSLAGMQRMFVAVLWAMHFITHLLNTWPQEVLVWLQGLGGQIPPTRNRNGLYRLLWGVARLWITASTLKLLNTYPPPASFG